VAPSKRDGDALRTTFLTRINSGEVRDCPNRYQDVPRRHSPVHLPRDIFVRFTAGERCSVSKFAGFRQTDGSVKYIRGRVQHIRTKSLLAATCEAMQGIDTPGARLLLAAESCLTSGRLHELAQAASGEGPTIEHQKVLLKGPFSALNRRDVLCA
jgi:hypothetical protein